MNITRKLRHALPVAALLLWGGATAQGGVVAAGGTATAGGHTLSYSVGQPATLAATGGTHTLHEGLQQPLAVEAVGIAPAALADITAELFPNPTTDGLALRRPEGDSRTLGVELFDQGGRLVATRQWQGSTLHLGLADRPAGVYLLRLSDGKTSSRTFKISKQ